MGRIVMIEPGATRPTQEELGEEGLVKVLTGFVNNDIQGALFPAIVRRMGENIVIDGHTYLVGASLFKTIVPAYLAERKDDRMGSNPRIRDMNPQLCRERDDFIEAYYRDAHTWAGSVEQNTGIRTIDDLRRFHIPTFPFLKSREAAEEYIKSL